MRARPDHSGTTSSGTTSTGSENPAGAARPGGLAELTDAMHGEDEELRGQARSTPAPDGDARHSSRAVDAPIARLSAHMSVAETILYPAARRALPDGARRTAALYARAREITSVLRAIEQILYGDARSPRESFKDLVAELDESTARLDEEEQLLVRDLEAALGPERSARLADQLRDGLAHAPTRPHPNLPRRGPWAKPTMRLLGRWDRMLNALNAREGAGVSVRDPAPAGLWSSYLLGRPAPENAEAAAVSSSTEVTASQPTSHIARSVEPVLPGSSMAGPGTGGAWATYPERKDRKDRTEATETSQEGAKPRGTGRHHHR